MKYQESDTVELKPSLSQLNEIVETIVGLANSQGGKVIIGVSNSGGVVGVELGKATLEKLVNTIKQNTEPSLYPKIVVKTVGQKKVIEISIVENKEKPVLAFGRAFKRVGKSTLRIDKDEQERMVVEKRKVYFDSQFCAGATINDIDEKSVRQFLQKAAMERRLNLRSGMPVKEALERLGLLVKKKLTNAALLLFGKNPQKHFLSAEVRCARFKGTEPLEFIDMKIFGGDIITQREDALEFVKKHINLQAKIVGTERVERWEYPLEAVREAITNALCHRDYEVASNIQIRIFDDRLEVWGCGPLPKPLTVEDLKRKHGSVLRNPLLAKCFFLIKYIEQWGTGTNRMIKDCLQQGLSEPLFEEVGGSLVVTFRTRVTEEFLREKSLNERQIQGTLRIQKEGGITNRKYQELYRVSKRTASYELRDLVEKKVLRRVGTGKRDFKYTL